MKRLWFPIALTTLLFTTAPLSAARPASVANTTWVLQVNDATEPLTITAQGGPGAPGAANCRSIRGEIRGVADIRGWYCPSTGRIHFVHSNVDSGVAVRVFTGNVSDEAPGQPLHMAGTMTIVNAAFGDLGEYNFSAVR
jgi:hypothetical protein